MGITLCICTYNRHESLKVTLGSLLLCIDEFTSDDEVLVIDNNSNDATKLVVEESSNSLPVKYHFEAKQGLAAARNKAMSEASNDVLVFIDDDITLSQGFLDCYRQAFLNYEDAHFLGGKIEVDWGGEPPFWYKSKKLVMINGLIGNYDLGAQDQEITIDSLLPYGANFAIRRTLFTKVGQFNTDLGVKGKQLGRGEETDYFIRSLSSGFSGMYIANACVKHRFNSKRLTLPCLYRYGFQKGVAAVMLEQAKPQKTLFNMSYQLCVGLYQLMKLRVDRFIQCVINIGLIHGIYKTSKQEVK